MNSLGGGRRLPLRLLQRFVFRSYCSMAPSEQCFYCRLSPCVGFASFTELDLKETWNILVALSTVRIQFLVFVFFFPGIVYYNCSETQLLLFSFPACTAFGGQRMYLIFCKLGKFCFCIHYINDVNI